MLSKDLENLAGYVVQLADNDAATPEKLARLAICIEAAAQGVAVLEALPVPASARPEHRILPAGVADLDAFRNGGAL